MKKLTPIVIAIITTLALTAGSSSVFADDNTPSTTGSSSSASAASEKKFQDHKAMILKRIGERLNTMQEIQNCVQAANDTKALHACKKLKHKEHHDD